MDDNIYVFRNWLIGYLKSIYDNKDSSDKSEDLAYLTKLFASDLVPSNALDIFVDEVIIINDKKPFDKYTMQILDMLLERCKNKKSAVNKLIKIKEQYDKSKYNFYNYTSSFKNRGIILDRIFEFSDQRTHNDLYNHIYLMTRFDLIPVVHEIKHKEIESNFYRATCLCLKSSSKALSAIRFIFDDEEGNE